MGLSLRARVRIGVAIVLVLLAAAAAVLLAATVNAGDARRDLRNLLPATGYSRNLGADLVDQQTNERGYIITSEERYLTAYENARQAAATDAARLREVLTREAPDLIGGFDRAQAAVEDWRRSNAEPEIAARRSGVPDAVSTLVRKNPGVEAFAAARGAITSVQAAVDDGLLATERRAGQAELVERRTELTVAVVLLGLGVGTLLLVRRWVLMPVATLRSALRRVAAGDLTAPVGTHGPPELADLGRAAEAMRGRIVSELAEAQIAREALEQSGPVVVGLRAELAPSPLPAGLRGVRIAAQLHAAEGVLAGDWYDTLELAGGRLGLVLTDVSGHGAQAGLVAARLKHQLTPAVQLGLAPHEALALAADGFRDELERFASCVIIEIDPADGTGRWANAGHEPPLVVPPGRDACVRTLEPTGPLLSGLSAGAAPRPGRPRTGEMAWTTRSFALEPGALLLAFTDGLSEARGAAGGEFGTDGVLTAVRADADRSPDAVLDRTLSAARTYAHNWRRDDVTLVVLARD